MVQTALGEVDLDVTVLEAVGDGGHLQLHDRAELLAGQGAEDNDVVESVFWECCEVGCMSGRKRALCKIKQVKKIIIEPEEERILHDNLTSNTPSKTTAASYLSHTQIQTKKNKHTDSRTPDGSDDGLQP